MNILTLVRAQEYFANQCEQDIPDTFPCRLPSNVVVPNWAYETVVNGVFNVTRASQVAIGDPTPSTTTSSHGTPSIALPSGIGSASQTSPAPSSPTMTTTQPSTQPITTIILSQSIISQSASFEESTRTRTSDPSLNGHSSSLSDEPAPTISSSTTSTAANASTSESAHSNALASRTKSSGPVIGAVVGGLILLNIVVVLAVIYIRRHRRRRQLEAALTTGPLDWWKLPPDHLSQPVHRAASECTTITPEDGDDLLADDEFAKKSVMYGNHPDI
ncbi:hypothetical protein ONZ51_g244 [Trametes cubensis]|uniref:Mid2 domain-containing protein n=1 Tax=Trametes cubensis TaxID=1111947 RepID=A0AAD7XG04_9APHY|nr:hypothetical protein ONZ51_g244 [Trametes cubensis]